MAQIGGLGHDRYVIECADMVLWLFYWGHERIRFVVFMTLEFPSLPRESAPPLSEED